MRSLLLGGGIPKEALIEGPAAIDREIDRLIRKYGYAGTPQVLAAVQQQPELRDNLSAAAHLIHGSTEGRFTVTYCPGHLT